MPRANKPGRKPLSARYGSASITVKFPKPLLNKVDRIGDGSPGSRPRAIRELIELGLIARKRIARG